MYFLCRFFHKWGPWGEVLEHFGPYSSYQTRRCVRCGKVDIYRLLNT